MDKTDLKRIQEQLPKQYAKLIKERTGKSYASIFKTFSANSPLIVVEVVDAAIQILEEKQAKDKERAEKIAKLC